VRRDEQQQLRGANTLSDHDVASSDEPTLGDMSYKCRLIRPAFGHTGCVISSTLESVEALTLLLKP
jgi:hypothetical protein